MKLRGIFFTLILFVISTSLKASDNINLMQTMYIYNFTKLIKWPEGSIGNTFVIGVYGSDQMFAALENYTKTRKVGTKNIKVINLKSYTNVTQCQIVFVSADKKSSFSEIKQTLGNRACLLISETEGTNSSGIEFVRQNNKLAFRLNQETLKSMNLIVSQQLVNMSI
jgi:hypothetical protein